GESAMPQNGRVDGLIVQWNVSGPVSSHELSADDLTVHETVVQEAPVSAVAPGRDANSFTTDRAMWRRSGDRAPFEAQVRFVYDRDFDSTADVEDVAIDADGATVTLLRTIAAVEQAQNDRDERDLEVWDPAGYAAVGRVRLPGEAEAVSFDPTG